MSSTRILREEVNNGIVDADFLIYHYASVLPVPQWENIDDSTHCCHCQTVLKSGKKHNCRLDGKVYCSACTTKLHLPEQYDLKGKSGPTRVCYGCRCALLRLRQAAEGLELDAIGKAIRVPTWQDKGSFRGCSKCARKVRSPHNCRCCGLLHCDDCSSKQDIALPRAFNKKNKAGPQRVCDGCRFRLIAGAVLTDQPLALPMPEPASVSASVSAPSAGSASVGSAPVAARDSCAEAAGGAARYQPKDPFAALDADLAAFSLSRRASHSHTPAAATRPSSGSSGSPGSAGSVAGSLSRHRSPVPAAAPDTPHPDAGTFDYPAPAPAPAPAAAAACVAGLGPRVMLDTRDILPERTHSPAPTREAPAPMPAPGAGVGGGAGSSEVHIEDHVLPSQLRRTVAEAYVPLPGYQAAAYVRQAAQTHAMAPAHVSVVVKQQQHRQQHRQQQQQQQAIANVSGTSLRAGAPSIDNRASVLVKTAARGGEGREEEEDENTQVLNV